MLAGDPTKSGTVSLIMKQIKYQSLLFRQSLLQPHVIMKTSSVGPVVSLLLLSCVGLARGSPKSESDRVRELFGLINTPWNQSFVLDPYLRIIAMCVPYVRSNLRTRLMFLEIWDARVFEDCFLPDSTNCQTCAWPISTTTICGERFQCFHLLWRPWICRTIALAGLCQRSTIWPTSESCMLISSSSLGACTNSSQQELAIQPTGRHNTKRIFSSKD